MTVLLQIQGVPQHLEQPIPDSQGVREGGMGVPIIGQMPLEHFKFDMYGLVFP